MEQTTQAILTVGMPTLAVLVGILVNNSRLTDLRGYIDARFNGLDPRFNGIDQRFNGIEQRLNDLKETLRAELRRVEEVMDARLKHLEEERHGK